LNQATAVTLDSIGNLYIADGGNDRIRKVTPSGIISTVAGNGTAGYSGDGGMATSAQLNNPAGMAIDPVGNLYIADFLNSVIRKVTPSGIISTVAGNGTYGYSGDGGQATAAKLGYPVDMAVDSEGNLYIADWGNNRIRKVTPSGIISTVAGNGGFYFSGDDGPATSAGLTSAQGIAIDSIGNLYIGDYTRVRKVTPLGIISTVAGKGTDGYSGDGGHATDAQIFDAWGIAVDSIGNLYIADRHNFRIRKCSIRIPRVEGRRPNSRPRRDRGMPSIRQLSRSGE
jgi:sugar lactone lactonase YvrE